MIKTKLKTTVVNTNENISFPVGTILAVRKYYEKLGFSKIFSKHKSRGRDINALLQATLSYKLSENLSVSRASKWINRPAILEEFELRSFHEKTLYRTFACVGKNREAIMSDIQDAIFTVYPDLEHTDINMDWSSLVLYGTKASLGAYGYSRDHRPDKLQLTLGVAEIAKPINIPIGFTVGKGNVSDQSHFKTTFEQVQKHLKKDSLVTFDKGANSKENLALIEAEKLKYLTAKKLNKSDDKRIKAFEKTDKNCIDKEKGIYGVMYKTPSKTDYFFYSEKLYKEQYASRLRKVKRQLAQAKAIQESKDKSQALPTKYRINNVLIDISYEYQTKLETLNDQEATNLLKEKIVTGREGFFCLLSTKDLTLSEALEIYRKKDSIEKIFDSLKNEIEIKPVRVWSDNAIYGALLIGFIAQLFMSLIKFDIPKLKQKSVKFIKNSLLNLTVTAIREKNITKTLIYSNFDWINQLICLENKAKT